MSEFKDTSGEMRCPKCKSTDVYWNGSQADADSRLYISEMYCEVCEKHFGASYNLTYTEMDDDE